MIEVILARYVYVLVLVLLSIGLYGALAKSDLMKKVIGLTIFSTAIYLFFIQGSLQLDGTVPIIDERGSDPALYVDPLPHLLILTAIVVGVGVSGVALALLVRLYRVHGTLDEAVIAERLAGREATTTLVPGSGSGTGGGNGGNGGNGHAGGQDDRGDDTDTLDQRRGDA